MTRYVGLLQTVLSLVQVLLQPFQAGQDQDVCGVYHDYQASGGLVASTRVVVGDVLDSFVEEGLLAPRNSNTVGGS